jgi:hypothetical protein
MGSHLLKMPLINIKGIFFRNQFNAQLLLLHFSHSYSAIGGADA